MDSSKAFRRAPAREDIIPLSESELIVAAPGLAELCSNPYALASQYKTSGGKSRAVLLATGTACIGGFLFGIDQGLISIILVSPQFLAVFPQIDSSLSSSAGFYKGFLTAMLELGAVIGALQSGFLSDKFSRKYTLFSGVIYFIVGGILQTCAYSLATLVAGRTISGIGIGILSSVAPTYVAEVSPPHLRGRLLVLEEFMIVFGIVVAYYVTYGTRLIQSEWSFRLPFLLQIFPALFLGGMIFLLPFSPRWLATQGRDEDALESLVKLRDLPSSDVRVQAEWIVIRAEAARCQETSRARHPRLQGSDIMSQLKLEFVSWMDCFSPAIIRRTHIGIGLMLFQQLVGINAIIYFSPTLFQTLGFDLELTLTMAGVANVCQLIAVTFALITIDKVGRRPGLLIGSAGMAASLYIVAILISQFSSDWTNHQAAAWGGVSLLFCYMLFFGIGFGPTPWSLPSEVHSLSFRAKGVAIATVTNWSGNFIVGLITPPMIEAIPSGTFIFFGTFAVLAGIWTYFIIPETRGRSLEQIDGLFKSNTATEDEAQKDEIVLLILSPSRADSLLIDESVDKDSKM